MIFISTFESRFPPTPPPPPRGQKIFAASRRFLDFSHNFKKSKFSRCFFYFLFYFQNFLLEHKQQFNEGEQYNMTKSQAIQQAIRPMPAAGEKILYPVSPASDSARWEIECPPQARKLCILLVPQAIQ